ncbi:hypothetical protein [Hoylesella timonensis]|nr:hypothetical protein [Hoylesella timonensis]
MTIAQQVQWSCPTILMFWECYLNELVKLRRKNTQIKAIKEE